MRRMGSLVVVVGLVMVLCAAQPKDRFQRAKEGWDACVAIDEDEGQPFPGAAKPLERLMREGDRLCAANDVTAARARFVEVVMLFRNSPQPLPHHILSGALRHIRHIDLFTAAYANAVAERELPDLAAVCREKLQPAADELVRPVRSPSSDGWCERPYELDAWLAQGDPGAKLFVTGLQHCRHAEWYAAFQYFREAVVWWAATRVLEVDEGYQVAVINMDHVRLFGFHEARGKTWHEQWLTSYIEACGLDPNVRLPDRCLIKNRE